MMQTFSLDIKDEEIVFAEISNRENLEVIIVCKSGNVFLFDCKANTRRFVADLSFASYKLNLQIYSFRNYVCVVEKNGTDGTVIDLSEPSYSKHLKRGDYGASVSLFPIAFYSKDNQSYLIHGTDWNRLDITCLNTGEILTNRIIDYETDSNYFDYFHSSLLVSPDSKTFTSNGWIWHPYGQITSYSIEMFLQEFELSNNIIELTDEPWELDWDRPLCWIDNKTLGIGYNQKIIDENKREFPSEIIFYEIEENKIIERIKFNGFAMSAEGEVNGELFFDNQKNHFIALNKQNGLLIADTNGKEIFRNPNLTSYKYSQRNKLFYLIDYKRQMLVVIELDKL